MIAQTTETELWTTYHRTRTITDRNHLVEHYRGWVRYVALRMARKMTGAEVDDLVQSGAVGLIDAIDRYRIDSSTAFTTFAGRRVVGAMIDDQRAADWVSRSMRRCQRRLDGAMHRLRQRLDRRPTIEEVAAELGVPLGKGHHRRTLERRMAPPRILDINDRVNHWDTRGKQVLEPIDHHHEPAIAIELADLRDAPTLTDMERQVVELHYGQGLELKAIAPIIQRHVSRVSQLHLRAVKKLTVFHRGGVCA